MSELIRPETVSSAASYRSDTAVWSEDTSSTLRRWSRDGQPLVDAEQQNGARHGTLSWLAEPQEAATAVQTELGLPIGPPDTTRLVARYEHGALTTATFHGPNDEVLLAATWKEGRLHGNFDWKKITEGEILRFGDTVVGALDVKLPRPHPYRGVSEFVDGRRASTTFYDAEGVAVVRVKPLVEWGQDTTRITLDGYVARGDFEADLAAFFPTMERITELREGRPLESWIGLLPEAHRPSVRAFDALVRGGRFPALGQHFDVATGYGFDAVKNTLDGVDGERWVGLSADESGDMHLLDITTGRVVTWAHDGTGLSGGHGFDGIDAYAFAMTRIEAAAENRISKKKVATLFEALGLPGGVTELGPTDAHA